MKRVILFACTIMIFACAKTEEEVVLPKPPSDYLKSNSSAQQLWLTKIDAILQLHMDENLRIEIQNLKTEVSESYALSNNELWVVANRLASLLTYEDFISLFVKITPYEKNVIRASPTPCTVCLSLLATLPTGSGGSGGSSQLPDCNCNWTCGDSLSSCTTSNCNHTTSGCGFLWLFACEEHDSLYPC